MNQPLRHEISSPPAAARMVVIMPNWLGDGVMATPFLRALRATYPRAYIAALRLPLIMPVLAGLTIIDEAHEYRHQEEKAALEWLRAGRFEVAYILPNSFRSAWMVWRAGIKRRIGYARGGRGWLLTKGLQAQRRSWGEFQEAQRRRWMQDQIANELRREGNPAVHSGGRHRMHLMLLGQRVWPWRGYKPVPTIAYYLRLVEATCAEGGGQIIRETTPRNMSSPPPPGPLSMMAPLVPLTENIERRRMTLVLTDAERSEGGRVLAGQGIDPGDDLVMLVPGANFGSSKCWPAQRFAQVADRLLDRQGAYRATVLLAGAPAEKPIIDAIVAASLLAGRGRLIALTSLNEGRGVSLGCVKALVARARLMICNDTGPRHFAGALGIPVVTLFGPTDPVWAETFYDRERQVRMVPPPPCGPCQRKRCPIDHRCMMGLEVADVMGAVAELWALPRGERWGAEGWGDGGVVRVR